MANYAGFRKAFFGGFRESDVVRYLDTIMKDHKMELLRLQEQISHAQEAMEMAEAAKVLAQAEAQELRDHPVVVETVKEVPPAGMPEELERLRSQNRQLSELLSARERTLELVMGKWEDLSSLCRNIDQSSAQLDRLLRECRILLLQSDSNQ